MELKFNNMKNSKFEEIIPASDLLNEELNDIRGGGIICESGVVCDVGEVTPDEQQVPFRKC